MVLHLMEARPSRPVLALALMVEVLVVAVLVVAVVLVVAAPRLAGELVGKMALLIDYRKIEK